MLESLPLKDILNEKCGVACADPVSSVCPTAREAGLSGSAALPQGAIAIVGKAFRFPGDLADDASLWQALTEGRDLVTAIPADRWATQELQHDKRGEPGRSISFSAGVLSRIDEFDAAFFGISPREASLLDPQQRMLLELAWEAMENAGQLPSSMAGSDCAVYLGISGFDYGMRQLCDLAAMTAHSMTGNTLSIAANRISYVFDLRGPSLAVDTACSSSLVALHHACNALRNGEASMALAGGVNLLLHPYPFVGFTKASMLSAEGRCKVFDASGDGYVRAEGGALLLLKPLAQALADGDPIEAVILASGINTDGGQKTGITIPSAAGQVELMRSVLCKSGLTAGDIDFVEAHGTGTAVGDPAETSAIGAVYGQGRGAPLPIGSIKANIGHMEAASGMGGLIKTVLALKNRALPPSIHLQQPNPNIDFQGLNLELVRKYKPLESNKPLVAGVNSFGFGGANAHVLLQAFDAEAPADAVQSDVAPPLFLSARNEAALRELAGRYAARIEGASPDGYYDIAFAALHRRERMEKRLALHAANGAAAADLLARFAEGGEASQLVVEEALPQAGSIAFVYSGNGSQWLGMGRALLDGSKRFAEIIASLDAAMQPLAGFSLIEELLADGDRARLDDTVVAQPLLFAIQLALTQMLKEQGVAPSAVAGHSVGEVAAAWAAGALTLEQAIRVICMRSSAQGATRGTGRMAALALSAPALDKILDELGGPFDIEIAGINSPGNITLSGKLEDLERIAAHAKKVEGVFCTLLDLDYAFHSTRMDPIRERLIESLEGLEPAAPDAACPRFVSTVTGGLLDGAALGADYWWRNVREPVRFADGVAALADLGCRVFIEIGPHAILQRYLSECLKAGNIKGRALPTLKKRDDGPDRLADVALRAHLLADPPDLSAHFPHQGRPVRLPNYPWQRERHWIRKTSENLDPTMRRRVHPLLGWRLTDAEAAWENVVDPVSLPWLADHNVGGAIVFPGAGYVEMALAAAREWLGGDQLLLEEFDIVSPLVFDGEHARTLRLILSPRDGSFQIKSRQRLSDDDWTLHAAGRLLETSGRERMTPIPAVAEAARSVDAARIVDADTHYRLAASLGLYYGPAFRGLGEARVGQQTLEVRLALPESLCSADYLLHPALLDVCYQSLVDFFQTDIEAGRGVALLPVKVGRLDLRTDARIVSMRASLRRYGARSALADFALLDADGGLVASLTGCRFRAAPLMAAARASLNRWQTVPRLNPHPADGLSIDLLSTQALLRSMHVAANAQAERPFWFQETLPLFEAMVLSFAYEAFLSHARQGPDALSALMAQASPYARWLAGLLVQEELLVEQGGVWELAPADLPPAQDIWQELLRDAPACLPQLTLLGRIGGHLPALLSGEADPRKLLEELRGSPAGEVLYHDDPAYAGTRRAIECALRELAGAIPAHCRLRVLEIAAQPGAMRQILSECLPEERFDYVLALPEDGAPSDAQPDGAFDVVVLRHVLHRAANPHALLAQVGRKLAGGGILLLAERHPDWSADLLEGLSERHWHEQEGAAFPVSSLLPPDAWRDFLRDEDWAEVVPFIEPAAEDLAEGAYLLLAKRREQEARVLAPPPAARWLLRVDEASSGLAKALGACLVSRGQGVFVIGASERETASAICDHLVYLLGWQETPDDAFGVLSALLAEAQALSALAGKPPRLWILTRGGALASGLPNGHAAPNPMQAALWGFGRVLMNEAPALRCTLLELDCDLDAPESLARLEQELLDPDGSDEIVLADKARYSLALCEASAKCPSPQAEEGVGTTENTRFRLDFQVAGQLRNLAWLPQTERALLDHEIEVRTQAVGLNFRDVMYAMGLLPDEAVENGFAGASLGLEFSGVVTRIGEGVRDLQMGDAVMGFGPACFASHVLTRADAVSRIPDNWSFEAAATVPTVFFTVYYALRQLADLQPGERVLIHGGAGGVGIAAIQLARRIGAEIFATAGSDEKRDFVRLLGVDHVLDSRSLSFADDILAITQGEGVDVIVNSLAGEAIRRNLRILKPFGRFLELGKRDFFENTPIGLRPFKDNISYFGIDADQLLTGRPKLAARVLREMMALFHEGELKPLPYRAFGADQVVDAFRVMQQSRHIGKIVVTMGETSLPVKIREAARPAAHLDGAWLVTGGLSGFGLESARWLAGQGVAHLALLGRRGADTPGAREAVAALEALGASVSVFACDVADRESLRAVIAQIGETMPPLKGVLHAAMAIDDRIIARLDPEGMETALRPKLLGAWNLHALTLDIPIEHFVLYSSVTTSIGNPGQANYVAANAGLEGLAGLRRHLGLPAACIGWGPIGDAGYLTRNATVKNSLAQRLGRSPSSAAEALAQLGEVLAGDDAVLTLADVDWGVLCGLLPGAASSRRFAFLDLARDKARAGDGAEDIRALLAGKTREEAQALIRDFVKQEAAQVLSIDVGRIDAASSLHDLGMDSLMAVELAMGLEQRFGVQLPAMLLTESPSIEVVAARIAGKLSGTEEEGPGGVEATAMQLLRQHGETPDQADIERMAEDVRALKRDGTRLTP